MSEASVRQAGRPARALIATLAVLLALAVAPILGLRTTSANAAPATGEACSTNSADNSTEKQVRCINGIYMQSRQQYLNSDCMTQPLPADGTYTLHACGGNGRGAEAIAQARFLN